MIHSMNQGLDIYLHSSRYDRIYQAVNLVLTASAMGGPCHLFLFFGALATFMADQWDEVNIHTPEDHSPSRSITEVGKESSAAWLPRLQKNFELGNFPSLYELLDKARNEKGGLTVCACSTSVRLLDLSVNQVRQRVDEIVGLSTMLQMSSKSSVVLYI